MSDDDDRCAQGMLRQLGRKIDSRWTVFPCRDTLKILVATDNHLVSSLIVKLALRLDSQLAQTSAGLAGSLGERRDPKRRLLHHF